jgi:hypothetical protein
LFALSGSFLAHLTGPTALRWRQVLLICNSILNFILFSFVLFGLLITLDIVYFAIEFSGKAYVPYLVVDFGLHLSPSSLLQGVHCDGSERRLVWPGFSTNGVL